MARTSDFIGPVRGILMPTVPSPPRRYPTADWWPVREETTELPASLLIEIYNQRAGAESAEQEAQAISTWLLHPKVMRLNDKTIVVTGASRGLGKAMADAFVGAGASVIYSSEEDLVSEVAEDRLTDDPAGDAVGIPADVRSWDDVRYLVCRTRELFGGVDVLVNNAGTLQYRVNSANAQRTAAEVPNDAWDAVLDTNLKGVFHCTKAVLPRMRERGGGRIIHISSGFGMKGRAEYAPYVASKFGLEGFHESLALELTDTGVESVALRPPAGGVYTDSSKLIGHSPEDYKCQDPSVMADPAIRLASGEGENGGRYQVTADGNEYVKYGSNGDK